MRSLAVLVNLTLLTCVQSAKFLTTRNLPVSTGDHLDCHLSLDKVAEIHRYADAVQLIADHVLQGAEKHVTYDLLSEFVDTFGARPAGSEALDHSIDHMVELLEQQQLDNVHTEPVQVPHWQRVEEWARLVLPFKKKLSVLALGGTVSTPESGILEDAVVVRSFEELDNRSDQVQGKIVIFAYNFSSYAVGYEYRNKGAAKASDLGAVAALIRSAGDFSLDTPHTGGQSYGNSTPIPSASITMEDALMFDRMDRRGQRISIHLKIDAKTHNVTTSRNTVAELTGTHHPEQLVIIGGHLDSWDVGQGAVDDAGGVFISWRALALLRRMGLTTRRTLRTVLWTGEEVGLVGAQSYTEHHRNEEDNISIALESDYGTFAPLGLLMKHESQEALCIVKEVLSLFGGVNNATLLVNSTEGPDLTFWRKRGVPTASLLTENHKYFRYHHTNADMVTALDPDDLDLCTAFWTALAYVLANLEHPLPRT